jgi:hypothetical protein
LINRKGELPGCDMGFTMFEVVIIKRSPMKWEWHVCDRNGNTIMQGGSTLAGPPDTRATARYSCFWPLEITTRSRRARA